MSKPITSYEIDLLAKEASEKFLKNKIPLDETISKMASERDLNFEQVQRVAEEANTGVYLNLFNSAKPDNRYVEFDVASVQKIASTLKDKTKIAGLIGGLPRFSDYFLPPQTSYIPAPAQARADSEKLASIIETAKETAPPLQGEHAAKFQELHKQAQDKLYQNAVYEIGFKLEKHANQILDIAKQDILSKSGRYEELELVFKEALISRPKIAEHLLKQLPQPDVTTKVAGVVNKKHAFYKEVEKLAELFDEYDSAKENPKLAHKKIAASAAKVVAVGLGIGIPTVGVGVGVAEAGKIRRQAMTSSLVLHNPAINKVK